MHSRCSVNNSCTAGLQHSFVSSRLGLWEWLELQKAPSACLFAADTGPIDSVSFFSPPPSPHSDSGSGSFQRLKAKLLESLCFYPPICSHLVGPGGGAAWPLAMLEVPVAGESSPLSFPRSLWALGTDTRWGGQAWYRVREPVPACWGSHKTSQFSGTKCGGRVLSKEGGIHSHHCQRLRIGPSLGQWSTRNNNYEGGPGVPRFIPQSSDKGGA